MKKFLILFSSLIVVMLCLQGCFIKDNESEIAYTDEPFMSELDAQILFADESYEKVNSRRNISIDYVEMYDVPKSTKEKLYNKVYNLIEDLNLTKGYYTDKDTHEYFKFLLDNMIQQGGMSVKMSTNSGYYYVTLTSDFTKNPHVDDLRKTANYVGINGAIGYDLSGKENVDELYLAQLIEAVNKNRANRGYDPVDDKIEQINYVEDVDIDQFFESPDYVSTDSEIKRTTRKTDPSKREIKTDGIFTGLQNDSIIEAKSKDSFGRKVRQLNYDPEEFNGVAGISSQAIPLIPNINTIFKVTQNDKLSGYSCYDWGSTIEEVKKKPTKSYEIVFVFKHNLETDDFDFYTLYPTKIDSGITIEPSPAVIGEFLTDQFEIKIDELHSAIRDKSISYLTSAKYVYPQDLGLYLIKQRDTINMLNSSMTLEQVIRRDNNTYLVEADQLSTEVIKGTKTTGGKYRRKWLLRYRIEGSKCVLDDMYLLSLQCLRIPTMDIDKGSIKKLYSIQAIKNVVSDELKAVITKELNKFASGLTYFNDGNGGIFYIANDKLRDDGTIMTDASGREAWGFVSRFNEDNSILNSKTRNGYIETLQTQLLLFGKNTPCVTTIKPTYWCASTDNQVELNVMMLFNYNDKNAELHDCYMVFSNFNNKWVIDEIQWTESQQLNGADEVRTAKEYFGLSKKEQPQQTQQAATATKQKK